MDPKHTQWLVNRYMFDAGGLAVYQRCCRQNRTHGVVELGETLLFTALGNHDAAKADPH